MHAFVHGKPTPGFLGLHCSQAVGRSEDGVALGVASAQTKTHANPHGEGSSLEEEDRRQHSAAEPQAGLDQCVRQNNIPLLLVRSTTDIGQHHCHWPCQKLINGVNDFHGQWRDLNSDTYLVVQQILGRSGDNLLFSGHLGLVSFFTGPLDSAYLGVGFLGNGWTRTRDKAGARTTIAKS